MCFLRFDRGIEPGMVAGVTDGLKLYPVGINAKGSWYVQSRVMQDIGRTLKRKSKSRLGSCWN